MLSCSDSRFSLSDHIFRRSKMSGILDAQLSLFPSPKWLLWLGATGDPNHTPPTTPSGPAQEPTRAQPLEKRVLPPGDVPEHSSSTSQGGLLGEEGCWKRLKAPPQSSEAGLALHLLAV